MKKRKELRVAIAKSADSIKSNIYLEMLLEVSEIFRKALDDKECVELTDLQWKQRSVIVDILGMTDAEKVRDIGTFICFYR